MMSFEKTIKFSKNAIRFALSYSAKSSAGSTMVLPWYYHGTTAVTEVKSSYFRGRGSTTVEARKIGYFLRRGSTMAVNFFFLNLNFFLAPKALIICLTREENTRQAKSTREFWKFKKPI